MHVKSHLRSSYPIGGCGCEQPSSPQERYGDEEGGEALFDDAQPPGDKEEEGEELFDLLFDPNTAELCYFSACTSTCSTIGLVAKLQVTVSPETSSLQAAGPHRALKEDVLVWCGTNQSFLTTPLPRSPSSSGCVAAGSSSHTGQATAGEERHVCHRFNAGSCQCPNGAEVWTPYQTCVPPRCTHLYLSTWNHPL